MLNPANLAMLIPIIALIIGLVSVLTGHQRKMAEIIHQNNSVSPADLEAIRQELQQMRMLMNQHTIALDDMRSSQNLPSRSGTTVQDRLGAS